MLLMLCYKVKCLNVKDYIWISPKFCLFSIIVAVVKGLLFHATRFQLDHDQ